MFDSAGTQSCPFFSLPVEILLEIFDHADALDQIMLALSCKTLLRVSTRVRMKILLHAEHAISCQSSMLEQLLRRIRPLSKLGRPKRSWAVCLDCFRYRPIRKSYWKKKEQFFAVEKLFWENKVNGWSMDISLQCPECAAQERSETLCAARARGFY